MGGDGRVAVGGGGGGGRGQRWEGGLWLHRTFTV